MSKIVIAWNNNDGAISNNDRTKLPRLRAEALQRAGTPPLVTRGENVNHGLRVYHGLFLIFGYTSLRVLQPQYKPQPIVS